MKNHFHMLNKIKAMAIFETFYRIKMLLTKFDTSQSVTAKLICVFVFAYANCLFSLEAVQL